MGNKVDRYQDRKVDFDTALLWAQKENIKLFEVSATERKTIIEAFLFLASKIIHPRKLKWKLFYCQPINEYKPSFNFSMQV